MAEQLALVDANDVPIGSFTRDTLGAVAGYGRVVNGFVVDRNGRVWVPTRGVGVAFPGALDFSVGGWARVGETYDDALARELAEETGIEAARVPVREVAYLTPADGVAAFQRVYRIDSDVVPAPEHTGAWLAPAELGALLAQGTPAKDDLVVVWRLDLFS